MKEAKEIVDLILNSEKIIITAHRSPDGDSVGCSLGLLRFIQKLGKEALVCHPDPCPSYLEWVKDGDEIIDFDNNEELVAQKMKTADLIFCLDYNGASRLGSHMANVLDACEAKKVMIDHHPNPADFVHVSVSKPEVSSTCQLIFELIDHSGNIELLNERMAIPIYLGIVTDTGSFRYSSVTPRTHEIAAALIRTGMNHSLLHENTFDNVRPEQLKLRGYALSEKLEIITEYNVAFISLNLEELNKYNYEKGDTEGLVNIALSVKGVSAAAFFMQRDGMIKISFRSKGVIPVNKLAADHFEGGGHLNAAGGVSHLSMEETLHKFKNAIPDYFKKADV